MLDWELWCILEVEVNILPSADSEVSEPYHISKLHNNKIPVGAPQNCMGKSHRSQLNSTNKNSNIEGSTSNKQLSKSLDKELVIPWLRYNNFQNPSACPYRTLVRAQHCPQWASSRNGPAEEAGEATYGLRSLKALWNEKVLYFPSAMKFWNNLRSPPEPANLIHCPWSRDRGAAGMHLDWVSDWAPEMGRWGPPPASTRSRQNENFETMWQTYRSVTNFTPTSFLKFLNQTSQNSHW